MISYIALLRGINVGGHKKVPMAALREILTKLGLVHVKTYIQSGNVVFQSLEKDTKALENKIQKLLFDYFDFEVTVIVRTKVHLLANFSGCPFSEEEKEDSYFALLSDIPDTSLVAEASKKVYENETYEIVKDCLYFYCANGYGKAKFNLNYFERNLRVKATSRNYKTMVKLLAMADATD